MRQPGDTSTLKTLNSSSVFKNKHKMESEIDFYSHIF